MINKIRDFLQLEAASGMALFCAALVAIFLVNSPWRDVYLKVLHTPLLHSSLIFWVNEGLMAIFFLLVGLELKREFFEGELSGISKIVLPGSAALGGMLVPALIYLVMNRHSTATLHGWAIPVATDIAFALGVLSFFNKRIPLALKLFLLTLAVIDDLGSIIIIVMFYSYDSSLGYVLLASLVFLLLWGLNRIAKVAVLLPYLFLGLVLWVFILYSGIHASITGVLLAIVIPLRTSPERNGSLLHQLEARLHPWVAFFILPLFAFCNAGLSFEGMSFITLTQPVVLGIALGLFVGKQVGVMTFVWLMIKCRLASLPKDVTGLDMYGIALLCGIGFTMSLFLGTLAFQEKQMIYLTEVRLGVFLGSILSALSGSLVLYMSFIQKQKRRFPFETE